jgi:signal transduction histidine kinase
VLPGELPVVRMTPRVAAQHRSRQASSRPSGFYRRTARSALPQVREPARRREARRVPRAERAKRVPALRTQGTSSVAAVTAVTAILCVTALAFSVLPQLHLNHEQWLHLRLALETSGSLVALIATFLVYGRLLRRMYLNELLLASGLAVLALSNLFFLTVPTVAGWAPDDLTVWLAPSARSLGGVLFTIAAFVPQYKLRRLGPMLALTGVAMITVLGLGTLFVHTFSQRWSMSFAPTVTPESIMHPALRTYPALLACELLGALLYGLAAYGFFKRFRRSADEFSCWLMIAAGLAVASHLSYALYMPLSSQTALYTGDVLRFAFYLALLFGCMREIWSYWNALSEAAVLEDRRRIARDLHDGVAQELAYIYRNLDSGTREPDGDTVNRLRLATERAMIESRRAVHALAPQRTQAVETALAEAAAEIAERCRIQLDLDLVPGIRLSPSRSEALVRIACEAITNAARHSGVNRVMLRLERDGSLARLRVADKGCGFDTTVSSNGFGLIAMRERAHSVGGEMRICSAPGRGSEVNVAV